MGTWVSESREIFQEGDLHAGTGEEHSRVPSKFRLAFDEEDASFDVKVVEGDSDGQRCRAETDANEVVRLFHWHIVPWQVCLLILLLEVGWKRKLCAK